MDENNEELNEIQQDSSFKMGEEDAKRAINKKQKKAKRKQNVKTMWKKIPRKIKAIMLIASFIAMGIILLASIVMYFSEEEEKAKQPYEESLKDTTQLMSLQKYLLQFSHTTGAPRSPDGTFYKLYGDGVGWPTIGDSDLQWKSNQEGFAKPGKVRVGNQEKTVDNVKNFVNVYLTRGPEEKYSDSEIDAMNIYIEIELVDSIGQAICENKYQSVKNSTTGLDLSEQQLYALTAISYNFGHLPSRNGSTFKETYEKGASLYSIDSWQHNRYVWDNWWSALGGGAAGHIPARDAAFETYVKGVFDFTQSGAGGVFSRTYYIYYTQEQLNKFSYAPNKPITRTASNEKEIFTSKEINPLIDSSHFDGESVVAAGYKFPHYLQNNFDGAYGTSTIPVSGCGPTSMAMILAGFCNDYSITPVTFIENLNKFYGENWKSYYQQGAGSINGGICNSEFLQKYYKCKSTEVTSNEQGLQAIAEGKCIEASDEGHIYAVIPVPDEYKSSGYQFYILDSALGLTGAYKSLNDFASRRGKSLVFRYIIEPIK